MLNSIGIIPARMGSSRFPGKPLARICGITMIEHVYKRSVLSKILKDVYVATCDSEIKDEVEAFGGKVVMTKDTHERASDRVAEAIQKLENELDYVFDIVVMIQGDEAMVYPEMIDEAVNPFHKDKSVLVTNLMSPLKTREEHEDANEVKVVVDKENYALYFSREPIPSRKKWNKELRMLKQVCIIPFRKNFLHTFNSLQQTPLEIVESIDMLRVLESGYRVKMVLTQYDTYSVDTMEDLRKVESVMVNDTLMKTYSR